MELKDLKVGDVVHSPKLCIRAIVTEAQPLILLTDDISRVYDNDTGNLLHIDHPRDRIRTIFCVLSAFAGRYEAEITGHEERIIWQALTLALDELERK